MLWWGIGRGCWAGRRRNRQSSWAPGHGADRGLRIADHGHIFSCGVAGRTVLPPCLIPPFNTCCSGLTQRNAVPGRDWEDLGVPVSRTWIFLISSALQHPKSLYKYAIEPPDDVIMTTDRHRERVVDGVTVCEGGLIRYTCNHGK